MRCRYAIAMAFAAILSPAAVAGPFTTTSTPTSNGTRAVVDLPASQHMKNVGGSDGLGLCVFTSLEHAARWANLIDLVGYRKWMEARPGGGYPSKVDRTLTEYCRAKGVPVPSYIQHTGGDDAFLDLAIRTGRAVSVTYDGRDGFYRGAVAHMVNLAHLDESRAAIIDNNRPGQWVWMSRADFLSRWRGTDGGWAVVFLGPPPTPYATAPVAAAPVCICGDECKCKKGDCPGKCPVVYGQCPGGRCPAPVVVPNGNPFALRDEDTPPPVMTWDELSTLPRGVLWVGMTPPATLIGPHTGQSPVEPGWPAGVYDYWRDANGKAWLKRRTYINLPVSEAPPLVAEVEPPTGVDRHRVHEAPTYAKNGQPCSRDEAHAAILSDDSDRWHVAAVGDPEFLGRVKADVERLPADVRAKMHCQYYLPSAWQVGQFGLAAGVTLRKPAAGRVSGEAGTVPAAEYSAERFADLCPRTAKPKPKNPEPGPPEPVNPTPDEPKRIPALTWLVIVAGLLILIFRSR